MFSFSVPILFVIAIIAVLVPTAAVTCNNGYCYEICTNSGNDDYKRCVNRAIDLSQATVGSGIDCLDDNTCINITLICPINSTVPPCPSQPCKQNCEIRGYNTIYQSHSNWTIYAPNSWDDITITDFNVFIQGTMNCRNSSSCDIQYGLWNCQDPLNPCFREQSNTNYIHCNTDYQDTQCNHPTNIITCPDGAEGEDNSVCNIICNGDSSCNSKTINCGSRSECNVLCIGQQSCSDTVINCPSASNQQCNIICGSPDNSNSCNNIEIKSYENRGNLNIYSMGILAMDNAKIVGPRFNELNIQCNNLQSCQRIKVFGNESDSLDIKCNANIIDNITYSSCQDMHIYCPITDQNCYLSGTTSDTHKDLQIFGGWDDITITDEYKLHSMIDPEGESSMHCGDNNYYDASCLIGQDWFCECPSIPTVSSTSIPTSVNFNDTNIGDGDDGDKETGYIVGSVMIILVFMAICFGCIYWYCCVHHKPIDPNDERYQKVKSRELNDNEMVNINANRNGDNPNVGMTTAGSTVIQGSTTKGPSTKGKATSGGYEAVADNDNDNDKAVSEEVVLVPIIEKDEEENKDENANEDTDKPKDEDQDGNEENTKDDQGDSAIEQKQAKLKADDSQRG